MNEQNMIKPKALKDPIFQFQKTFQQQEVKTILYHLYHNNFPNMEAESSQLSCSSKSDSKTQPNPPGIPQVNSRFHIRASQYLFQANCVRKTMEKVTPAPKAWKP